MSHLLLRGGVIAGSLLLVLYGLYDLTRRRMRRQADDSGLALAFELVEGESLDAVLARGPMAPADARRALMDICAALTKAHLRRQAQGAPEAATAADLQALALLAYEMLTGRKPEETDEGEEITSVTSLRPELPAKLDEFFAAALSGDAARRPADAAAFCAAFEACWG
jgi:serine/threonine protein kinase